MSTLLDERYAPVTSSVGFLEVPLPDAIAALAEWRQSLYSKVATQPSSGSFPDVLRQLEPLMSGARPRELLVAAGSWTAYFDNSLRGTDAVSAISVLCRRLKCQGLAIEDVPHTIGLPGVRQGRAGAVQFTLFGPIKTSFLNYVRTVSVAFDGSSWVFNAVVFHDKWHPFAKLFGTPAAGPGGLHARDQAWGAENMNHPGMSGHLLV